MVEEQALEILTDEPLVVDLMTARPYTVWPDSTLADVAALFARYELRHAPVVERNNNLVGVISQRDLFRALGPLPTELAERTRVEDVMSTQLDTVMDHATASDAARHMLATKRGCLPVVEEDGSLVGIITESDYLRAFVRVRTWEDKAP